ncbi:MAG TPA: Uma2 family endonuclease [Saprospiraceae bacterium]|nr:Uma2 family endonuclease [Saprospiraceae bacterium]HMP23563.1 Uma2 family endonuclease [Saprospiraceae bacterium]
MTITTAGSKKIAYREFREMEFPDDDLSIYELVNGEIVKRNSPTAEHQMVSQKLLLLFLSTITGNNLGQVYYAPLDVALNEQTVVQPDLIYLAQNKLHLLDNPYRIIMGTPDLVVEIISPSSIKLDKIIKKNLYERFGVHEYWLVDPNNQSIEVYALQDGKYILHAFADATEQVQSVVLAGLAVAAKAIFE